MGKVVGNSTQKRNNVRSLLETLHDSGEQNDKVQPTPYIELDYSYVPWSTVTVSDTGIRASQFVFDATGNLVSAV